MLTRFDNYDCDIDSLNNAWGVMVVRGVHCVSSVHFMGPRSDLYLFMSFLPSFSDGKQAYLKSVTDAADVIDFCQV